MAKQGPEGPDQDATGDRAEPSNSGGSTDAARGQDTQIRRTSVRERLAGHGSEESGSGTDRPGSAGDDATEELQPEDSEADAPQADERGAAAKPGEQGPDERSAAEGPPGGVDDAAEGPPGGVDDAAEGPRGGDDNPAEQEKTLGDEVEQDAADAPGDPARTDEREGSDGPTVTTEPAGATPGAEEATTPVSADDPDDDPEATTVVEPVAPVVEGESAPEGAAADELDAEPDPDVTAVAEPDEDTDADAEATVVVGPAADVADQQEADPQYADAEATVVVGPAADVADQQDADAEATAVVEPAAVDRAAAAETADVDSPTTGDQDTTVTPKKRPPKKKRRLARAGMWLGAIVLVLGGLYVLGAYLLADRVPADTTVAGVDISGLSADQAVQTLEAELGELETEPVPLAFQDAGADLDPESAGMAFDAEATVDQFTGFTMHPQILLGHIFGLWEQNPVTDVDDEHLDSVINDLAGDQIGRPWECTYTLVDGDAEISEPEDGAEVEIEAAVQMVANDWLTATRPLELPVQVVEPEVGAAEIDAAMTQIVEPFLSGPVIVAVNDAEVELTTEELVDAAALETDGPDFMLVLDGQELAEVVTDKEDSIGEAPSDARIELQDGEPAIVPAVTGTGLDPEELGAAVHDASLRTGAEERVAELELTQTEAEFTTEDAEALGVVEEIGYFATPMPYDPPRTENLVVGTSRINNTLIMPGENFSLLDALSPISVANGYNSSGVVVDGFATEAAGGGLSQLSTTVFNAAFEAGLEDVTHQPHSRWFSRYPEGREATLFSPDLDMIFGNNTDYGVLIQSWVGDGQTHVRLWGTDVWDVQIVTGNRDNTTSPQTVYNQHHNCTPESRRPTSEA